MKISQSISLAAALICMIGCTPATQSSETAVDDSLAVSDSLAATNTTIAPVPEVPGIAGLLKVEGIQYLDDFTKYTNEEGLIAAFGKDNITKDDYKLRLFPGTTQEAVFSINGGTFAMIEAGGGSTWAHSSGLKMGMSYDDVMSLNGSGFAFQNETGFSGPAGGKLDTGKLGFGFSMPGVVSKRFQSDEWITGEELGEQGSLVLVNSILVYYEDQSEGD
jgi:hypothetical protein